MYEGGAMPSPATATQSRPSTIELKAAFTFLIGLLVNGAVALEIRSAHCTLPSQNHGTSANAERSATGTCTGPPLTGERDRGSTTSKTFDAISLFLSPAISRPLPAPLRVSASADLDSRYVAVLR